MDDNIYVLSKNHFPDTLKNMHNPPARLYIRGKLATFKDQKYLCVVGSRLWTTYGRDTVNKVIGGLKGYPISIVSGLALGIDGIAHEVALETGLHCVGFPGSSLEWNALYPPTHLQLAKNIIDSGGALLSKWRSDYPTGSWAFPERNRFMAGISHATLIIEAGQRSGSLMTAKHAEEYDRDVLAVPGSIFGAHSYGPHMLIKRGAAIITSANDILEALGFESSKNGIMASARLDTLDSISRTIIEIISLGEITIDDLALRTGIPIHTLNEKLVSLELEGLIRNNSDLLKFL
ncbi:MAG: DNA-processing protein DprA [Candidatus Taylorbacteria bacterium]|nr:DNA-processing protein DprA [Candidatus Taylorbacteria bacterium]